MTLLPYITPLLSAAVVGFSGYPSPELLESEVVCCALFAICSF